MKNNSLNFQMKFLPTDIISTWKRASLSSIFCSNLLDRDQYKEVFLNNIIATVINECLELVVKYGAKKTENYTLACNQTNDNTIITLSFFLQFQQISLLKSYIKKIYLIKKNNNFESILFTKNFSELGYAIYSFIEDYNGKIKIDYEKKPRNASSILKTQVTLNLNNKDLKNDY